MVNLWDYLTQPSRANTPINKDKYLDETMYTATAVPRFIATSAKSVYDSFKRGLVNPNLEDAFNVAGGTMTGSMPFAPKGAGIVGTIVGPKSLGWQGPTELTAPNSTKGLLDLWKSKFVMPYGDTLLSEISDKHAFLTPRVENAVMKKDGSPQQDELFRFFNHPELFENYPFLRHVPTTLELRNLGSSFTPALGAISIGRTASGVKGSILHELTHALQLHETGNLDFSGSPFTNSLRYTKDPGERLARAVSDRQDFSLQQLKNTHPLVTAKDNWRWPANDYEMFTNTPKYISNIDETPLKFKTIIDRLMNK